MYCGHCDVDLIAEEEVVELRRFKTVEIMLRDCAATYAMDPLATAALCAERESVMLEKVAPGKRRPRKSTPTHPTNASI